MAASAVSDLAGVLWRPDLFHGKRPDVALAELHDTKATSD
jgi:hypothetical protein